MWPQPPAIAYRPIDHPRSLGRPLGRATRRLVGGLALGATIAGCAAGTPATLALDSTHYAWCNTAQTVCTGWRGPGAYPAGDTTPVGSWIIPAGDGAAPQPRFIPGEAVVEGEVEDFY